MRGVNSLAVLERPHPDATDPADRPARRPVPRLPLGRTAALFALVGGIVMSGALALVGVVWLVFDHVDLPQPGAVGATGVTSGVAGQGRQRAAGGTATYVSAYSGKLITLRPPQTRQLDLDQPLLGASDSARDVTFRPPVGHGPSDLDFDARVATASGTATADQCLAAVSRSTNAGLVVPRKGTTWCAVTDGRAGKGPAGWPKVVRLTVVSVSGDGVVVLKVSAWRPAA
jgi:hypothetical protein